MLKYVKIINLETKQCEVSLGENANFYQSLNMTEQEVEQAYDERCYLIGFVPEKQQKLFQKKSEMNAINF